MFGYLRKGGKGNKVFELRSNPQRGLLCFSNPNAALKDTSQGFSNSALGTSPRLGVEGFISNVRGW